MNERIRELRRRLKLNQTEFGQRIGVTQKPISEMESGGTVTERNFNAICKAFNVNPSWLRDGKGAIFVETREVLIQTVADEYELSADEILLMRTFLALTPEQRQGVLVWAKKFAVALAQQMGVDYPTQSKQDKEMTPEEAAEVIRQEWSDKKAAEKRDVSTSLAFIGTSGTSKKNARGS